MPGLFDLLMGAAGRPDPTAQLYAALGQAPGQPGSNTGPIPGAPPAPGAPQGGGPPSPSAAAGGPPAGPPGAPQGPPPAPPQPQAYTSAPDLAAGYQRLAQGPQQPQTPDMMQLYMQMAQRAQASEQFNRGIAGFAAAFAPPRDRAMVAGMGQGQTQDPNALFDSIMKLQQFSYLQQQQRAMQAAAPDLAQKLGVPLTTAQAIIASGKFGEVEATLAGVAGDPTVQAMNRDKRAWMDANLIKDANGNPVPDAAGQPQYAQPMPDKFNNVEKYKAETAGAVATQQQRQKDIVADQANYAGAKASYDRQIADVQDLLDSTKTPGLDNIVGPGMEMKTNAPGSSLYLSADTQNALAKYNKIMATQYVSGVQDFHGAGRISQQELAKDAPSQSVMGNRALTPQNFRQGGVSYLDKLKQSRADLAGKAGQLGSLSDADYALVNPIYKPGGDLYVPGQPPRQSSSTDLSSMSDADANAAYDKLPSGAVFIGPDKQPHRKP